MTNFQANLRLTIGLFLAGLIVLFTLQNTEIVELHFILWQWSMPRAVMTFIVLTVGIIIGWILSTWMHYKRNLSSDNEA